MWEFLVVVAIYIAVSFVGMAVFWTVAARKGAVRAPSYFFWMNWIQERNEQTVTFQEVRELGQAVILESDKDGVLQLGLAAMATLVLATSLWSGQTVVQGTRTRVGCGPEQVVPNQVGAVPNQVEVGARSGISGTL